MPVIGDKTVKEGLGGAPPNLANPPSGCRFHPRCPLAIDICQEKVPEMMTLTDRHRGWHATWSNHTPLCPMLASRTKLGEAKR
ncbi:MAG: hypothetical protein R2932_03895 [Caldilineaceae bacterium]